MAVADAAKPLDPRQRLAAMIDRIVAGKRIDPRETIEILSQWFTPNLPRQEWRPPRTDSSRRAPPSPVEDQDKAAVAMSRKILGFGPREAITPEMIQLKRRRLARQHHPDLARTPELRAVAEKRMASINAAADVLLQSLTSSQA